MKKIIFLILTLILVSSVVLADSPRKTNKVEIGIENPGSIQINLEKERVEVRILKSENNSGEAIIPKQRKILRARDVKELKEIIRDRREELNQQIRALKDVRKQIHQNQNRIRLAVHSLLAMENLTGGIGPQVREIAREFNNSVQATIRAEERIQTRWGLLRFLIGGDNRATKVIEDRVNKTGERIEQLKQLMEVCDCSEEVKAIIQEQIQNIEQELERLQQVAETEKKHKGIFGWLWK